MQQEKPKRTYVPVHAYYYPYYPWSYPYYDPFFFRHAHGGAVIVEPYPRRVTVRGRHEARSRGQ